MNEPRDPVAVGRTDHTHRSLDTEVRGGHADLVESDKERDGLSAEPDAVDRGAEPITADETRRSGSLDTARPGGAAEDEGYATGYVGEDPAARKAERVESQGYTTGYVGEDPAARAD